MDVGLTGFIGMLLFVAVLLAIRWIRVIKINSTKQVEQNEEIINLLRSQQ
ncbi:hypothetical protein [Planococcus koreensis]